MPGSSKKGGGLQTKSYSMKMGSHSEVCESAFKKKDKEKIEKAAGKKPLLPGLQG